LWILGLGLEDLISSNSSSLKNALFQITFLRSYASRNLVHGYSKI